MSVCGGLGFISWAKRCCLHWSNTSSFMSTPWCYSVRNYFSEYTAFWKDVSPPCFSCSLILLLSLSVSYQHTHTAARTQPDMHNPLKTGSPPYSNFVRSWQCLDLVVWLFRPVFPAALMWTGHPAGHQRIPLHGSRIAGSFYLWRYRNEWVLVSKHFTMLLQPHTKATDFQQICTYFIQED